MFLILPYCSGRLIPQIGLVAYASFHWKESVPKVDDSGRPPSQTKNQRDGEAVRVFPPSSAPHSLFGALAGHLSCFWRQLKQPPEESPPSLTMAYSPSPTSPLAGPGRSAALGRRSVTPPAQPLSKRDKKRNQYLQQRQGLLNDFNENREHYYREQLIALQHDMNLIIQCDPYEPSLLEDTPEEIDRLVEATAANTPYQNELSSLAGKWYAEFVHEVNAAKEQKEIELIQLMKNHEMRLERLKYECDYKLHLAAEEYKHMSSTLRERLVQYLTTKRQRLLKDKEQLDIADTNALLLHPSQFSITNPSSPGGGPTSRKTRNTKHRADMEEVGNSFTAEHGNRRKRKAPDDDFGSPSRNGHSTPAERAKAHNLAHQTAPAYTIQQLFTEKELNYQSHQAQIAARHFFSTSQKEGDTNGAGKRSRDSDADKSGGSGQDSGAEDDEALEAPEMDRTASQNVHVTRSTRTAGALAGLNLLSDLAEKAATRPALPYATLHSHQPRQGTWLPSPSRLMSEEIQEDLYELSHIETQPRDYVDKKIMDEALKPTAEGRSNLAPDWPVYMDMHLVDIDPRRAPAVS